MSDTQASFVKLNVGGRHYETSLSTINNCPNSMLAKAVSDRWKKEDHNKPIPFDRDGQRFKYVLDYLRDGKVNLPVGETKATLHTELEYFGIDFDPDSITSDEDVTLISFHHRFEGRLSQIEKTMKARREDYAVYKVALDVYKEAVVQNAKKCTSGSVKIEFEIKYFRRDDVAVYDSLDSIYSKGRAQELTDAINIVVKDVHVVVTAIENLNFRGDMTGYKIKVESRGQKKRSREEKHLLSLAWLDKAAKLK